MAKPKTMILYALGASMASMGAAIAPARERGQAVRLIALEEFRGETEQNAGAVYVERSAGDELVFDRIQQAYPMIVVADWGGGVDVDDHASFVAEPADETIKQLRLRLIGLGGSAPAGADAGQLSDLIAAQEVHDRRIPILPSPASAGTVIPDSTPIVQRTPGDQLVDSGTGTSAASLEAATEAAGAAPTGTTDGTASTSTANALGDGDATVLTADQLQSRNDKAGLLALAKEAGVTDVTEDNNKAEIAAKIVAAREA